MRCLAFSILLVLSFSTIAYSETVLDVYAVNYPLAYFSERIGGDHVTVHFPAPPDIDPAFWNPENKIIREYQQADLIILNGAGYAKWTGKVSLPMLRTIDTSRGFRDQLIAIESNVTHSHGPKGDHSHGGTAFTTWLDFSQAAHQAEAIYTAFSRKRSQYQAEFEKNLQVLKEDLMKLDSRLKNVGDRMAGVPLLGSHPIYQYMARRYNLNLTMVMWEPDVQPDDTQWKDVKHILQDHPAAWMIWEGQPLAGSVEKLSELDVKSLVISPCFSRPPEGDFISVMEQNVSNMEKIVE